MQLRVDVIDRGFTADKPLEVLLDQLLQLSRALAKLALQRTNALGQLGRAALSVKYCEVRLGIETFLAGKQLLPRDTCTKAALPLHARAGRAGSKRAAAVAGCTWRCLRVVASKLRKEPAHCTLAL
jgi:hypothetical protein